MCNLLKVAHTLISGSSVYLFVSCLKYSMTSARSCGFLKPANAIFVPGMYFFGFSKYCNERISQQGRVPARMLVWNTCFKQCLFLPNDAFIPVRVCVREPRDFARLTTEQPMQVGSYFVWASLNRGTKRYFFVSYVAQQHQVCCLISLPFPQCGTERNGS